MVRRICLFFAIGASMLVPLQAKSKKPKTPPAPPKDEIQVVGHIPLTNGPVTQFFTTPHYSSYYLYAEREGGRVMLIDVSKADKPSLLGDVVYNSAGTSSQLTVVAGTAALVTNTPSETVLQTPQTIRIMDFSDPKAPKVAREFSGVTAMSRDERRGLIFIANPEGIWILRQHLAEDPAVEKAYANYVLYGPSMFPPQ